MKKILTIAFILPALLALGAGFASQAEAATITAPVVKPTLKLKSPNGGETFTLNSTTSTQLPITWNTTGLTKSTVKIGILLENSKKIIPLVAQVSNTGSYTVTIPATFVAGSYRMSIAIDVGDTTYLDLSDTSFTFKRGTTNTYLPVTSTTISHTNTVTKATSTLPTITRVESKAAEDNELYANEKATVYGENITKKTKVFIKINGKKKYFTSKQTQQGSITITTFKKGKIPNGTYELFVANKKVISEPITITYTNPKKK